MTYKDIKLVKDTISIDNINDLIEWLKTNPQLTKGELTKKFEKKWSDWLGVKYSVFMNSGSSANLAMFYSLMLSKKLKNKKIIVPAVSWVTTVSPVIQLGLDPIMCDCDENNLGLNIDHLTKIIEKEKPSCLILVHVLGIPNNMNQIMELCHKHDIIVLEDTCEAVGSKINEKKLGSIGLMSSFSFYYGHHMSTIEGGMVSTNDDELYELLLSIRSHGWDRDLPELKKQSLRNKYKIDDFRALYTFYQPGFNLRSTDLQAFLGLQQLESLEEIIDKRSKNFEYYDKFLDKKIWRITPPKNSFVSNFAYPIITSKIKKLVKVLNSESIECRPLICGSISEQPFWYERYGKQKLPFAKKIHKYGLYLPNHQNLSMSEIKYICEIVNKTLK